MGCVSVSTSYGLHFKIPFPPLIDLSAPLKLPTPAVSVLVLFAQVWADLFESRIACSVWDELLGVELQKCFHISTGNASDQSGSSEEIIGALSQSLAPSSSHLNHIKSSPILQISLIVLEGYSCSLWGWSEAIWRCKMFFSDCHQNTNSSIDGSETGFLFTTSCWCRNNPITYRQLCTVEFSCTTNLSSASISPS